jgi:hypothetical protein
VGYDVSDVRDERKVLIGREKQPCNEEYKKIMKLMSYIITASPG